jgi:hypothetical protein
MRVSDSIVTVTPAAGRFSSFTTPAFHRAPRNSLALRCTVPWVSTSPDTTQRFVCRDVARMLVDSLGAREFSFGSGAGWPFHAVEEGQPALRYFHYAEPEDWRRAYDLLQGYSHRTMARLAPNARVELQNHCSRLAVLRIWARRLEGQVGWSPRRSRAARAAFAIGYTARAVLARIVVAPHAKRARLAPAVERERSPAMRLHAA